MSHISQTLQHPLLMSVNRDDPPALTPRAATSADHKSSYRSDIDGLRAVAVLSVILFHIDKTLLPGGVVGVDIFFVISGFLISRNILQDIEVGKFSIADFYRRRIKRIAPPMLLVVAATVVAAQFVLLPEDAEKVAESAWWSLASLANVYFWLHQDTSYFAAASNETPLLHLWSLGIEEQFYLLWPLILMAVYRRSRAVTLLAAAALVASLSYALGDLLYTKDPSFVYYMLATRAGELLMGAIAALILVSRRIPAWLVRYARPISMTGLVLMIGSLFMLSEAGVFPGIRAVPATLGTALLILTGDLGRNAISRALSLKPLVGIGLLSYSAYLWHWPLLAFYRYGHQQVGPLAGAVMVLMTFLLAWLTYRFAEQPARRSTASTLQIFIRQYALPGGALALFIIIAMKIDGYGMGWFTSYKPTLAAVREAVQPPAGFRAVCQRQKITAADLQNEHCVLGAHTNQPPQAILWGDSNAAHYVGMLGEIAQQEGFRFRNVAVGACPPLLGDASRFVTATRAADCRDSIATIAPLLRNFPVVIISASWTHYQDLDNRFLATFQETVQSLVKDGKLVVLIGKVPGVAGYDRRCREKALRYPGLSCPLSSAAPAADVLQINAQLRAFALRTSHVKYYDATPYLCPDNTCRIHDEKGVPRYADASHLSMAGSTDLGRRILKSSTKVNPFDLIRDWPLGKEGMETSDKREP